MNALTIIHSNTDCISLVVFPFSAKKKKKYPIYFRGNYFTFIPLHILNNFTYFTEYLWNYSQSSMFLNKCIFVDSQKKKKQADSDNQ